MCWLPQLSNQLGYMFPLIFEIYASVMFFCAHQLFDQLNAVMEKRDEILPYICSGWLLPRKEIPVTHYMATWFKTKVEFL